MAPSAPAISSTMNRRPRCTREQTERAARPSEGLGTLWQTRYDTGEHPRKGDERTDSNAHRGKVDSRRA